MRFTAIVAVRFAKMLRRFFLLAIAALTPTLLAAAISCSVRDYGAKGDGTTKDTAAFQRALDACAVNGGGEVLVPAGHYLIGSVQLGTHTLLRLAPDAVIVGSPDLMEYPICDVRWEGRWQPGRRGLIYASAVENIGIVGSGRIEGSSWGTNAPDGTRNPVVIEPVNCAHVRWEGFSVVQGGHWATHPTYCRDVAIRDLTITSKRDGIDVDSCQGVTIEHCTITTGDDCISLKSGRGLDGARIGRACEDVVIENCLLTDTRWACLGIGSETSGGVRRVRIENCRMRAATHAIYLKTRIGRAGVDEDISGEGLEIFGGDFLRINLVRGGNNSTADDPVPGPAGYPAARNLHFTNIRMHGKMLVMAKDISPKMPLQGLTIAHVSGQCTAGMILANMSDVALSDIQVTGYAGPLLSTYHVTGTGLEGAQPLPAPIDPPAVAEQ